MVGRDSLEPHSELDEEYQGKGLGQAMYEAVYAHALHNGVKNVAGGVHTGSARKVHERLSQKHGFDVDSNGGNYSYAIKSEGLEKAFSDHHDPRERALATHASMTPRDLLRACLDPHPDVRAAALAHPGVTPRLLKTLCAARRLSNGEHPGKAVVDFLGHRHTSPEHIDVALAAAEADPSPGAREAADLARQARRILTLTFGVGPR